MLRFKLSKQTQLSLILQISKFINSLRKILRISLGHPKKNKKCYLDILT
jgi:hypothetical protein